MKKRLVALAMTALMAVGTLAGCGNSNDSSGGNTTTGANGGSETTKIRVALWDYSNTEYYKTMFDAFHEVHPEIEVEVVEFAADEYSTVIQTQLAGKANFDVVFNKDLPTLSQLISQGHLYSIDDLIANDSEFNLENYAGLVEQLGLDGKTYGLPFRKDNYLVYYNKDLFDAAGVDYPTDGMTMQEYEDLAAKMTSGSGNDKVYGAHFHTWLSSATDYARRAQEYNPIDPSTYTGLIDYYKIILDMQDNGYVQDYGTLKSSNIHYSGVMYNQEAAMLCTGTWFINMLVENAEFNWDVVSMPSMDGLDNSVAMGGVTPVSIGAYAEHVDEAWTFMKYVCGEEGAKVLASTGIVPGFGNDAINAIFDALPETNEYAPENLSKHIDISEHIIQFPMDVQGKEIDTILGEEHSAIMTGSITPEEGVQNMIDRITELQSNK